MVPFRLTSYPDLAGELSVPGCTKAGSQVPRPKEQCTFSSSLSTSLPGSRFAHFGISDRVQLSSQNKLGTPLLCITPLRVCNRETEADPADQEAPCSCGPAYSWPQMDDHAWTLATATFINLDISVVGD